ncbi:MAG TPA: hypothetical protein VLL75_15310 [Vicinamibacteria bacterium]|nr:hypothetical protein [Vicinamibacteria bacterium]
MTSGFVPRASPPPPTAGAVAWRATTLAPRASEQAVAYLGSLCLRAFLAAQFLSLTRLFFARHLGEGFATFASLAGILSVALLFPALLTYGLQAGSLFGTLTPAARFWSSCLVILSVFLFLYGWLGKGYVVSAALHDLCPYLVIAAAVILGSNPRAWEDTDRVLVALFLAGLVLSAAGMTEITQVVSEEFAEDRAGVSIVAYRMQGSLAFWPLLFLTARRRRPLAALFVHAGVFFVLGQQILFQKRSPSVRVLLYVLVFLVVLPRLAPHGEGGSKAKRHLAAFTVAGALALLVALTAVPWLFQGQAEGLLRRLSGQAYSGGAAAMLSWENERFFEAAMFFRTLQPEELVFGRGFGGCFVPDAPGWGVWLDDVNVVGRRQLHVGGLMPFFKGGFALALLYYAGLAGALWRGRLSLREHLAAAAFFVVLIHAVFLLQEGWFTMSVSFDLVAVGLCMGHLLSLERGIRPEKGTRGLVVGDWPRGVAA